MRAWTICILFSLFCFGCCQAEETRRNEAEAREADLKWIELALQNYHSNPADSPQLDFVADLSGIVDGNNQFALDLYQQLRTTEGNLFFSPSSISTALAMTYAGAAGETEVEMASTLHIQMPNERLHDS